MRSATVINVIPSLLPAVVGLAALGLVAGGCRPKPAPKTSTRVEIPPREYEPLQRQRDEIKPLPERQVAQPPSQGFAGPDVPPPPFEDLPLVNQRMPEQKAFLDAYEAMGRPRIVVFVNRTLQGELVPVVPGGAIGSPPRRTDTRDDPFSSDRPRSGEYDEINAGEIDYGTMETILTDWLAAGGRVEIVSPLMARQRLTDQQVRGLEEGRAQSMSDAARQLDADILVQVQARPTRQTPRGAAMRMIAEAINVRGGQSIGRGVVDVPPPLDKPQLDRYTRHLARRLMDSMTGSWRALASDRSREREQDRDAELRRDRAPAGTLRPADEPPQDLREDTQPDSRRPDPRRDGTAPAEPPVSRPAPTTRPSSEPETPAQNSEPAATDNK